MTDSNPSPMGPPCITDAGVRARYLSHLPIPKQAAFMATNCLELGFIGGAGGGKTWGLLAAALQFCDVPGYHALILRKYLTDLRVPGGIIDQLGWILAGQEGCRYNANERRWRFDSGASLSVAYVLPDFDPDETVEQEALSIARFGGSEFSFIGVDQVHEFATSHVYQYLFSRFRRPLMQAGSPAPDGVRLIDVPFRMRATGVPNLPGQGPEWFRDRFGPQNPDAPTMSCTYRDNPRIDPDEYAATLSALPGDARAALLDGEWREAS